MYLFVKRAEKNLSEKQSNKRGITHGNYVYHIDNKNIKNTIIKEVNNENNYGF